MPAQPSPVEPVTERCLAALALGLSASWIAPEQKILELQRAADPCAVDAARASLRTLARTDPQAAERALRLIDLAFPTRPGPSFAAPS